MIETMKLITTVLTVGAIALAGGARGADLEIVNALIYPSADAAPIAHGAVLIHDGRIAAVGEPASWKIPRGTLRIDAGGAPVTAGFWNNHVHLLTPPLLRAADRSAAELSNELRRMLTRWGFTTVFDLASQLANTNLIRSRIAAGEVVGPQVLTVGDPFFPDGGTPIYVRQFLADNGFPDEEIKNLDDALARERRQLAAGADGIKIFAGAIVGGDIGVLPMPLDQARAICAVAHAAAKPVFAHPSNMAGLEVSIDSGVDILAHTTPDGGPWSAALAARIKARGMALIPTLTLFDVELTRAGAGEEATRRFLDTAVQQIEAFSKAGGQVLFGTDVGYTDAVDTTEEYRQMGRALDWRQILTALTAAPAQRFGYGAHKGRVAKGMDADLVVLDGDPAADVTAYAKVRMTIRGGRVIFDARTLPPS
jgi:imidazolonepropionase-like amidohydrolase